MKKDDQYYPGNDRRYEDLTEEQIPLTESLMDCMERGEDYIISLHLNRVRFLLMVCEYLLFFLIMLLQINNKQ